MKTVKKSALVILCTLSLAATSLPTPVAAEDLQQQLNEYQQQSSALNSQISAEEQKEKQAQNQVLAMQQSIQVLNDSIARYQTSINEQQKSINDLTAKQQALEAERDEHEAQLGKMVKGYYEGGLSSYIEALLDAKSIGDLVTRIDQLQYIVTYYDKVHKQIASLDQTLATQKSDIQKKNTELAAAMKEKQTSQQSLQVAMAKEQSSLSQLSSQKQKDLQTAADVQDHINSVSQLIAQENLERELEEQGKANGIDPGAGDSGSGVTGPVKMSGTVQALLAYAEQFLGTPYVWGGTTPSGFDCSGLVQYVYRHFGVNLNRTSQMQYLEGTAVSRSNLQPGDLLFFQTVSAGASHVGIYVGNNVMIDASSYGVAYDNITVSYWATRYLGARRVIQ